MRPQAGVDLFEQFRAELFDPAWSMLQSLTIQKLSILRAPFSFLRSDPVLPSEEPGLCQYSGLTRFRPDAGWVRLIAGGRLFGKQFLGDLQLRHAWRDWHGGRAQGARRFQHRART